MFHLTLETKDELAYIDALHIGMREGTLYITRYDGELFTYALSDILSMDIKQA